MVVVAGNKVKTIVLVGRTGNGISATGNSIIGRKVFDSRPSSAAVTSNCRLKRTVLEDGQSLNVIDTPGLFDSSAEPLTVGKEIAKCINMTKDGIHAFILVLSVRSRFSREDVASVEILRRFFGSKIGDYMIVVFAGGDALGQMSLDDYLACNLPEYLERTLKLCGNRCVLFDNMTEDERKKSQQVKKLMSLVDTVVKNTGGVPYTNELFVELKMAELILQHQTTVVGSKITGIESFNSSLEDQLNGSIEMIESRLRESISRLENKLAEEHDARLEAEETAQQAQRRSNGLIIRLAESLERAHKEIKSLRLTDKNAGAR